MAAATDREDGAEAQRLRNALLVHLREEFVAPAASIVGFAEIAIEDTERLGLDRYRDDLVRIRAAGTALQQRLNEALAQTDSRVDIEAYRAQLRHDLRTPINAVKGYAEMMIEDATADAHAAIVSDLRKLLDAAEGMLGRIDALVSFTGRADGGAPADADAPLPSAARVLAAIRDVDPGARAHEIAGRVLVVDDNAANRDLLARRLAREGHAVEIAAGGGIALDLVRDEDFDLILLDILMPDMSGYDVLATLKADPRTREIPVIMISALDDVQSIVRCIEAGAADYLPKPFEPALLRARLRSCLENKFLRDRERAMLDEIRAAKERNEALLLNILPKPVVDRINGGATMVADQIADATILFADLVDFTPFSSTMSATDLVGFLNQVFSAFDKLTERFGTEKIKTIGDAYMVAVGIPEPRPDHAEAGARMALSMLEEIAVLRARGNAPVRLRIGLHSGPVVAGVIGERKFAYDIWGTTVNLASRMESHGLPDRIHVTRAFARHVEGKFRLESRGPIEIKGAGLMETYFLDLAPPGRD